MLLAKKHIVLLLSGMTILTLAVTVSASSGPTITTARAQVTDPLGQNCWSTYVVPGAPQHTLWDLAAVSPTDLWAVGAQRVGDESKTFVAHWDAKSWNVVPSPNVAAGNNALLSVSAVSANDVWAAGQTYNPANITSRPVTLIVHWNGTRWEVVPSPRPGAVEQITALSSNDVWAVGTSHAAKGDYSPFVLHWDGRSWNDRTPTDPLGHGYANAVAAISPSDVWVLGTRAWHWDGTGWRHASIPSSAEFYAVSATGPRSVWAAGNVFSESLVMRWDGIAWTPLPSPNMGQITGITVLSDLDVWVVSDMGQASHWNGGTWTQVPLPISGWHVKLNAPVAAADNLWFVASYSNGQDNYALNQSLIIRYSKACADRIAGSTGPLNPPMQVPGTNSRFFETGKRVNGLFLDYWDAHGGVAQQGLPLTELVGEVSPLNNVMYTVQYFERAVFEYHPENRPPYNVLLSQLGTFQYKRKYPNGVPGETPNNSSGSVFFPETGKRLGGRFLEYWRANGGLMQQGYPISNEFVEVSELNGQPYTVQYFERAVFEMHPENARPNDVLLSHLARFRYYQLYANVPTPAPLHSPTPMATGTARGAGTATATPTPCMTAKQLR